MLTQSDIDKYKAIYKKVYGKEITDAEALEQGTRLINLFKIIARPIPENAKKDEHPQS